MTKMPSLIRGAQAGILATLSLGFRKTHIEVEYREIYDTVRAQEFNILPRDLEEDFSSFNTLFVNKFQEGETERMVSIIPADLNRIAEYMAAFGMENSRSLVQSPTIFWNLQHLLDRDMGMALPYTKAHVLALPSSLSRSNILMTQSTSHGAAMNKEKFKVSSNNVFIHNGLLSQQAQQTQDKGKIIPVLLVFNSPTINLDKEVFLGIYAKDVLDSVVTGHLGDLQAEVLLNQGRGHPLPPNPSAAGRRKGKESFQNT